MSIIGFDHVQLAMPRGEESAARDFYVALLGLTELSKPAELSKNGGAWFACGNLQLHLGIEQDFRPAKKAHPGFRVTELDDLIVKLRGAGCQVNDDISVPSIRRAFVNDPFGNRLELVAAES